MAQSPMSHRITVGSGFAKDPTNAEKLYTIQENLKNTDYGGVPFNLRDVIDKDLLKDQNLKFQQRTAYKSRIKNEWLEFMADTSINFFDTNKLYVKSLMDYQTRNSQKKISKKTLP
jgi:hypothetical protein